MGYRTTLEIERAAAAWTHTYEFGPPTAMVDESIGRMKRQAVFGGVCPDSIVVFEESLDGPFRRWVLTGEFCPKE